MAGLSMQEFQRVAQDRAQVFSMTGWEASADAPDIRFSF